MCKTKQGSKLVDMEGYFVILTDVEGKEYHMSTRSVLQILADYVFEVDDSGVTNVLHSPEYWLPKGEDIV